MTKPVPHFGGRLTLPDQVRRLKPGLGAKASKRAVERAFRLRELAHEPLFAVPYDDAEIDWKTGKVILRRGNRQPFTPTASLDEFEQLFAAAFASSAAKKLEAPVVRSRSPTPKDSDEFRRWVDDRIAQKGTPPIIKDCVRYGGERGLSRGWVRNQRAALREDQKRKPGGQKPTTRIGGPA